MMPFLYIVLLIGVTVAGHAAPQTNAGGGTVYLKDADSYVGKAPEIPKTASASSSRTTPKPTTTPGIIADDASEDATRVRRYEPPPVIHRSALRVGQQIPVPSRYAPPQVIGNNPVTVAPATPTSFGTVETGITTSVDSSGNLSTRDTELAGFVNYGTPIRALVPVYNQQGQQTGTAAVTISSNPVIVPVTTTIEMY